VWCRWRQRSCPATPWSQGGGEKRPKMEGHRVVVVFTREKEDGGAWVRNWLRDSEIRRSGWPNGGSGFHGVSPECFIVGGGAHGRKGSKGGKCGGDQWLIKPQTGREERGGRRRSRGGRSGERVQLARAEEGNTDRRPRSTHGGHKQHGCTGCETKEQGRDADMWAPLPQCRILNQPSQSIQTRSNLFQIISNMIRSKKAFSGSKILK
jgi:hypothetical protein